MLKGRPRTGVYHSHKYLVRLLLGVLTAIFLGRIPAGATLKNYKLTYQDKPFAIQFIDKKHGWVVGDQGLILRTEDGGLSWVKQERITATSLFSLYFADLKEGWLVGKRGLILHTENGGEGWENQKSGTEKDLMAVKFLNTKRGFAVGAFGTILQTTDGGTSWQIYSINWKRELKEVMERTGVASPHLYDIFFIEKCGYIVGENGVVLLTIDGGANWELARGGLLPPLFSVYFKDCSTGWAVGQNGLAMTTNDGGKTWEKIDVPARENLFKVRMVGDFGLIVGDYGTILVSYNGGKTWGRFSQTNGIPLVWLIDVHPKVTSDKEAVIIGKGLLKTIKFKQKE